MSSFRNKYTLCHASLGIYGHLGFYGHPRPHAILGNHYSLPVVGKRHTRLSYSPPAVRCKIKRRVSSAAFSKELTRYYPDGVACHLGLWLFTYRDPGFCLKITGTPGRICNWDTGFGIIFGRDPGFYL